MFSQIFVELHRCCVAFSVLSFVHIVMRILEQLCWFSMVLPDSACSQNALLSLLCVRLTTKILVIISWKHLNSVMENVDMASNIIEWIIIAVGGKLMRP